MTFLLVVAAALLALSGGLKLRSTLQIGLGVAPLGFLELVFALLLATMIVPNVLTGTRIERWSVPVAIVVMIASSVDHWFRLRAYHRRRAETEGGRLASYVRYLADQPGAKREDP